MAPERAKTIRLTWEAHKVDGFETLKRAERFCVPYPMTARIVPRPGPLDPATKSATLEYHVEHAVIDGQPMSRVVCEGIQVAIFRRAPAVME